MLRSPCARQNRCESGRWHLSFFHILYGATASHPDLRQWKYARRRDSWGGNKGLIGYRSSEPRSCSATYIFPMDPLSISFLHRQLLSATVNKDSMTISGLVALARNSSNR